MWAVRFYSKKMQTEWTFHLWEIYKTESEYPNITWLWALIPKRCRRNKPFPCERFSGLSHNIQTLHGCVLWCQKDVDEMNLSLVNDLLDWVSFSNRKELQLSLRPFRDKRSILCRQPRGFDSPINHVHCIFWFHSKDPFDKLKQIR